MLSSKELLVDNGCVSSVKPRAPTGEKGLIFEVCTSSTAPHFTRRAGPINLGSGPSSGVVRLVPEVVSLCLLFGLILSIAQSLCYSWYSRKLLSLGFKDHSFSELKT